MPALQVGSEVGVVQKDAPLGKLDLRFTGGVRGRQVMCSLQGERWRGQR